MDFLFKTEHTNDFLDHLRMTGSKNPEEMKKGRTFINSLFQHYTQRPERKIKAQLQAFKKQLQAFNNITTKEDLPVLLQNASKIFIDSNQTVDEFWRNLFEEVPNDPKVDFFEIYDITSGSTFKKMKEGEKVEIFGVSGSNVKVPIERFGGALGFTDDVIRYRKIWQVFDKSKKFRYDYYKTRSDVFGGLINAAVVSNGSGYRQAYDTTGANQLEKDINTLNAAGQKMKAKLAGKPYANLTNPTFYLVFKDNAGLRGRLNKVFKAVQSTSNSYTLDWNIIPMPTENLSVSTTNDLYARLIFPNEKLQWTNQSELENYNVADFETLTYAMIYYSWMGAVVGDTDQILETRFV